ASALVSGTSCCPVTAMSCAGSGRGGVKMACAQAWRAASTTRPAPTAPASSTRTNSLRILQQHIRVEAGPVAAVAGRADLGDLAAHLVLRERRPDAAAGVAGGPLAGYTARVQQRIRSRIPFPDLVRIIRSGPPALSVMALPGMDERVNAVEFFVHHEDVRRGAPGWEPRTLGRGESDMLWHRLRMARFMLRKAPVGVELARD